MSDASRVAGAGKVRLGDVAKIDGRIPYPKTNDVWLLNLDKVEQQSGRVIDKLIVPLSSIGGSTVAFDKSCVLYSKLRPNLNKVVLPDQDGVATSELLPLKCDSSLDRRYLCAYLRSPNFVSYAVGRTIGAKMPRLSSKDLLVAQFSLPPLPTQQRIADELDQLCALKKNAEDRLAILDQIVKSRFVEMFGDLKVNNKGWRIGSISDVATYWNGLTYKPEHVTEDGVIVLRSSNVQNGVIDLKDLVRVSLVAKEKNIVQAGDVLMCSRNGSAALVGKTAIIPKGLPKMYFGAFMMIVRGKYPEFLSSFFATRYFRDQIACGKTSTVNQITCSMMNQVRLPIPPEELMREFAAFVAEVDKSKVTLRETVATLDLLYRAKFQEYFG